MSPFFLRPGLIFLLTRLTIPKSEPHPGRGNPLKCVLSTLNQWFVWAPGLTSPCPWATLSRGAWLSRMAGQFHTEEMGCLPSRQIFSSSLMTQHQCHHAMNWGGGSCDEPTSTTLISPRDSGVAVPGWSGGQGCLPGPRLPSPISPSPSATGRDRKPELSLAASFAETPLFRIASDI